MDLHLAELLIIWTGSDFKRINKYMDTVGSSERRPLNQRSDLQNGLDLGTEIVSSAKVTILWHETQVAKNSRDRVLIDSLEYQETKSQN